jgi:hypothetical protein
LAVRLASVVIGRAIDVYYANTTSNADTLFSIGMHGIDACRDAWVVDEELRACKHNHPLDEHLIS